MATQERYPNRWVQLVLGIICMATVANCQYGWTLFVAPIEDKYHWARTAIQLSFTIFLFFETWLVPIEGWAVDKFGPRPVIIFGAILVTIGWIMCSYASSLGFLYAAQVLTGAGAGAVYGTCSGNSLKWFPDKRGLAAGATAAGFGGGAAITVIPVASMINSSGYEQAFFVFGIVQGVIITACALFMPQRQTAAGNESCSSCYFFQEKLYPDPDRQRTGFLAHLHLLRWRCFRRYHGNGFFRSCLPRLRS